MSLQEVKGKILLSVKKPTGFSDTNLLSYDSISCKPHSGERKNPPANKQKKIQLIITFGLMEQSGFQCWAAQTSLLTHHLHTVSVNRSELVLQQNSLQPQWRTVEKTARPWKCTMEYLFCHSFCNSCKNTKGTMKCLVGIVLIRHSALNLPNRYFSDSCAC